MHPIARRTDVIVQDVGPDTLVYDQLRDTAHSLSSVAGYVFKHADGATSVAALAAGMSAELGVPDDTRLTEAALWQLERANLLTQPASAEARGRSVSRREALRGFGVALSAAAVTSMIAPTPAMARSVGKIKRPKKPKVPKAPKSPPGKARGRDRG